MIWLVRWWASVIRAWHKERDKHVCSEFTQWVTKAANYTRCPMLFEREANPGVDKIEFTKRWQERKCTICGALQQRELAT